MSEQETNTATMPTQDDLLEAARNQDTEAMDRYNSIINGEEQSEAAPVEPVSSEEAQPTEAPATPDMPHEPETPQSGQRLFDIISGGEKVSLNDDDGYLGYGSVESLKKSAAHKERHIKTLEEENAASRAAAEEATRIKEEFEKKLAEITAAKAKAPAPVQEQPIAPATTTQESSVVQELGDPPAKPSAPFNPDEMTSDEISEWNKYLSDSSDYQAKIAETLRSRPGKPEFDPTVVENIVDERSKAMQDKIDALEASQREVDRVTEAQKRQETAKRQWLEFDAFQTKNKTLATPKPLNELHKDVETWSDAVASRFGVKLPYNATAEQYKIYRSNRQQLVQRFLDEDPDIVRNVSDVAPPEGYENYYTVAAVNNIAKSKDLSLDDALVLHLNRTGQLQSGIDDVRISAQEKARREMGQQLKNTQGFVNGIPNSVAQSGDSSSEMTDEKRKELLGSMDPREIMGDPEKMKLFNEIGKKSGW